MVAKATSANGRDMFGQVAIIVGVRALKRHLMDWGCAGRFVSSHQVMGLASTFLQQLEEKKIGRMMKNMTGRAKPGLVFYNLFVQICLECIAT